MAERFSPHNDEKVVSMFRPVFGIVFSLCTILLMANLSSLADSILHPEIPYFDEEHLIVGGITAAATAALLCAVTIYIGRIRRVNEQLQKADTDWNNTFDAIGDAVSIHDREMNIVKANRAAAELFAVADPSGMKCYRLFHDTDAPVKNCPMLRMLQSGNPEFDEFFEPHLQRPLSVSCFPIFDGKGELTGGVHVASDITERKRVDDALTEREEKLRSLTQMAQDAIVVMDNDGNISFWNPAAEKIFGYGSSEAVGRELHVFIGPQRYYESYRKGFGVFRETGQGAAVGRTLELEAVRKGGEEFPIELSLSAITINGRWHAVGIIRDITGRKRAEEKIRMLNEELEHKVEERTNQLLSAQEELVRKEKLAILGQLAGSVGHELRNPLGAINNAVYFLKTVMPDAPDPVKEYLGMIKSEVDNSERIISDLLDFSRTKTPRTQAVGIDDLIVQSLGRCTIPANVRVEMDIPPALSPVTVDPLQMCQVLQNLITNACQAMPEGGVLHIAARQVSSFKFQVSSSRPQTETDFVQPQPETSNSEPETDFIEISVSDTGEGIPPENMNKLFQALFTTKAKGIGLGLVASRRLAEANGGSIAAESELGKGTTFTVAVPAKRDNG